MDRNALIRELCAGATVVTANDRLARALQQAVADRRRAEGARAWATPQSLTLAALLDRQHEALCASGDPAALRVMDDHEAEVLWEKVVEGAIARVLKQEPLLQVRALARLAHEARGIVLRHRLGFGTVAGPSGELGLDAREFRLWHEVYGRRLVELGATDQAALPDLIAEAWRRGAIAPPTRVIFEGFDETTPQLDALIDALEVAGATVVRPDVRHESEAELAARSVAPAPQARRVVLADARREIEAAAAWAADRLAREPTARIGIVVRDLETHRQTVIDALDAMLDPAAMVLGSADPPPAPRYNLSLGGPLAAWPLIHDALRLLRCAGHEVDWRDVSGVLRSPFFAQDRAGAAALELWMRRHLPERFALDALRPATEKIGVRVGFLSADFPGLRPKPRERRAPGEWAERAAQLLAVAGWPVAGGDRALDHAERQTLDKWDEALRAVGQLEPVLGPLGWPQFLSRLAAICHDTHFQPRAPGDPLAAPIQVLGYLEGAVLRFDALWVMGMDDESWPPPSRPNPLLPIALQQQAITPGSSADERLVHARRITARLLEAAPTVVVSSPAKEGEADHRPSPLVAHLEALPAELLPPFRPIEARWAIGQATERFDDAPVPLVVAPGERARGGTSLITHQSQCPFRAFAQHRLDAQALEQPRDASDPAARGELIHDVLHRVWDELGAKSALDALLAEDPPVALAAKVKHHVLAAIELAAREQPAHWPLRLKVLEQQRLTERVLDWLREEARRAPFTVRETERWHTLEVGGLALAGRIDRVDEVGGKPVYIDYKTGAADWRRWFTARPQEPQLPLYAIAGGAEAAGLMYAKVRVGEHGFAGVAAEEGLAPGVERWPPTQGRHRTRSEAVKGAALAAPDWPALQRYWREHLGHLAAEHAAGIATVTPARDACRHCHLPTLCRIDELGGVAEDDEAELDPRAAESGDAP